MSPNFFLFAELSGLAESAPTNSGNNRHRSTTAALREILRSSLLIAYDAFPPFVRRDALSRLKAAPEIREPLNSLDSLAATFPLANRGEERRARWPCMEVVAEILTGQQVIDSIMSSAERRAGIHQDGRCQQRQLSSSSRRSSFCRSSRPSKCQLSLLLLRPERRRRGNGRAAAG